MATRRITDEEFLGWNYYHTMESGFWVYYAPDSLEAALVDPGTHEIMFIIDRKKNEKLYQHPNMKKFTKKAFGKPLDIEFNPRAVI